MNGVPTERKTMHIAFCMRGGPSVTALQNEIEKRTFRLSVLSFALIQMACSIVSIAIGSLMLTYGSPTEEAPWKVGAPVWGGILVLLAAASCLISVLRCLAGLTRAVFFYMAYSFQLLELVIGSLAVSYSVKSYKLCAGDNPDISCSPDEEPLVAMSAVSSVVNGLATALAVVELVLQSVVKSRALREVYRVESEEKSRSDTA